MGKKLKISKEQIYKMYRSTRREEDIENGNLHFKHKVHKSKKQYSRNKIKSDYLF